ncbi:MAG: hypothetical protein WCO83_05840 [Alphaproteobacteria bacterium]
MGNQFPDKPGTGNYAFAPDNLLISGDIFDLDLIDNSLSWQYFPEKRHFLFLQGITGFQLGPAERHTSDMGLEKLGECSGDFRITGISGEQVLALWLR